MESELITQKNPKSPVAEIFRTLRTNIQFTNSQKSLKTLLVTSTMPEEGKTWIASNLAITFAQAGKRVVLIDADMRKGRLHKLFQVNCVPGLSNYLSGISDNGIEETENILKYVNQTEVDNLYVITSGNIPPNPSELLTSEKTSNMLEKLKEVFDIIIIDGTPSLLVTDAVVLSRIVDSTVIISAYKITKKDGIQKVQKAIENVGGKIAGVILNKMPENIQKYKSTYYYGSSKSKGRRANNVERKESLEKYEEINAKKTQEIMSQLDEYLNKNK